MGIEPLGEAITEQSEPWVRELVEAVQTVLTKYDMDAAVLYVPRDDGLSCLPMLRRQTRFAAWAAGFCKSITWLVTNGVISSRDGLMHNVEVEVAPGAAGQVPDGTVLQ